MRPGNDAAHDGDAVGDDAVGDDADDGDDGVRRIYQRRIYLQVNPPLVYPPGFWSSSCWIEYYDCHGNVDDDDDLSVTLVSDDGILCNAPKVYPPDYFGKLFKKVSKRKINRVLR